MKVKINLKALRKNKGYTQEQLAQALGLTWSTVQVLETQKNKSVSYQLLGKLCDVLDCEPGDLLKLEKNNT